MPINPYQQILAPSGNIYPVQAKKQIVQQLSPDDSSDETSSSDDDGVLNQIGTQHVQMINTMPTEGINLNSMHFQYDEPISTAISCQIPNKIKKRIWGNQFIDLAKRFCCICRKLAQKYDWGQTKRNTLFSFEHPSKYNLVKQESTVAEILY